MECVIKEHIPISLTFTHGDLATDETSNVRCEMLSEITGPHTVSKVALTNTNDHLYLGSLDKSNLCDNFIAVRNKTTKSVRFYALNNFFMCPYRREEEWPAVSRTIPKTPRESLTELNKLMGSKKSRNRLIIAERNAANLADLETCVKLAAETDDVTDEPEISSSPAPTDHLYLPPCDRNAKKVNEAYKIHDLVSEEVLDDLDSVAKDVMKMDVVQIATDSRFSPFIMKAITHVSKNLINYKILLFIDQLLAFGKSSPRLLSDKAHTYCSFSSAVNEKLIEDFTIPGFGGKRLRTPTMRDKILCYALVLMMICCGYKIDIGVLGGIVSPSDHQRLPSLLRTLGARSGRSAPSIFKLKVPIGEPAVKKQRFSTKRR